MALDEGYENWRSTERKIIRNIQKGIKYEGGVKKDKLHGQGFV